MDLMSSVCCTGQICTVKKAVNLRKGLNAKGGRLHLPYAHLCLKAPVTSVAGCRVLGSVGFQHFHFVQVIHK